MSTTSLDRVVADLETKADKYQVATDFEAKLQEYTGNASSLQSSLYGLQSRLEEMERLAGVYFEVFGEDDDVDDPEDVAGAVEDARTRAQRVLDQTADDYWRLINEDDIDDYKQTVQAAKKKADTARQTLRDAVNRRETYWKDRIETGRTVLTLMSNTREAEDLLYDIETFVGSKIWKESNSIASLRAEWKGIQQKLEGGTVADWGEFQDRHGLSDDTIEILKRLAEGERISLDEIDRHRGSIDELLDVDDLRSTLEVTL